MPANDFAPPGGGVHVIKHATLLELLRKLVPDPEQFEIIVTEKEVRFRLRRDILDVVEYYPTEVLPDPEPDYRNQIAVDPVEDSPVPAYIVRGNNAKGSVTYKNVSGVELSRLDWQDGLVTTTGDGEIIVIDPGGGGGGGLGGFQAMPWAVTIDEDQEHFSVSAGWVYSRYPDGTEGTHLPGLEASAISAIEITAATTYVYAEVQSGIDDVATLVQISYGADIPDSIQATPSTPGYYYYPLAVITSSGTPLTADSVEIRHIAGAIIHTPMSGNTGYVTVRRWTIDPVTDTMTQSDSTFLRFSGGRWIATSTADPDEPPTTWGSELEAFDSTGHP